MSVILKTKEEIQAMAGGLLCHLDLCREVLVESKTYQKIKSRAGEGCGENIEELFICWLMFRMWVANKVAYSVQYGESVDIGEGLPELTPCHLDLSELSADLRNLNYNIYTNGGQYWLDHDWHNLFMLISDRIKEESEIVCAGGRAMKDNNALFESADVIYSYTRAQAIADGVLIDATETAREVGILFPVAVTAGLYHQFIVPNEPSKLHCQSTEGRLWDTLWLYRYAAAGFSGDLLYYEVLYVMEGRKMNKVKLKALCGPGDNGEPVITIMLPDED